VSSESSIAATTVECVAERGKPVTLICVGPDGAQRWLDIPVRAVAAYQRASLAGTALVVALAAVALRTVVESWPWWQLAGLDLLVTVTAWLLVARVSDHVLDRVVESVATDTANTVLGAGGKPTNDTEAGR
jgi:hypothetical protein